MSFLAPVPMPTRRPVDRRLLSAYLGDHLAVAAGARARARMMARRHALADHAVEFAQLARHLDADHALLTEVIDDLGIRQPRTRRLMTRAGEAVGRLKVNGRWLRTPPTTPLLEIELMRALLHAQRSMWLSLEEHADELGLDADQLDLKADDATQVDAMLERLHTQLRRDAFDPEA